MVLFIVLFMVLFMVQCIPLTENQGWFVTLRGTWGFYLNHVHHSLSLRLIECALHNVLLEHGELPRALPFDVHLDLGLPDTKGYLRLLPEPSNPTQGF